MVVCVTTVIRAVWAPIFCEVLWEPVSIGEATVAATLTLTLSGITYESNPGLKPILDNRVDSTLLADGGTED